MRPALHPAVAVRGLVEPYDKFEALRGVDLAVRAFNQGDDHSALGATKFNWRR